MKEDIECVAQEVEVHAVDVTTQSIRLKENLFTSVQKNTLPSVPKNMFTFTTRSVRLQEDLECGAQKVEVHAVDITTRSIHSKEKTKSVHLK